MPRRTNLFQQVVAIVHQHVAGNATVEESAMLTSRPGGVAREVDVVILSSVGGYECVISIEATARRRPVDITWVEAMVSKHSDLPTSKLILVSESGFTREARRRAEERLAVPLAPGDLDADDPNHAVLSRLTTLWPKHATLTARQTQLLLREIDERTRIVEGVPLDTMLYLENGQPAVSVGDLVVSWAESGGFAPLVAHLRQIDHDDRCAFFARTDQPPTVRRGSQLRHLYFGEQGQPRCVVEKTQIEGDATIEIGEIPLRYKRLGAIAFAYGEGTLGAQQAVAVVTNGRISVRVRPASNRGR